MIPHLDLQLVNRPYMGEITAAMRRVAESGWYVRGQEVKCFEQEYAAYIGTRHCVGVANGLEALTLIFRAYRELGMLQEGDEVIVPANTYIASILAITENRLTPVLVEPSLCTLQMDDTLIERAITPRTKAILVVHLYGRCAYTATIGRLCRQHSLLLIEDNAQAHGCVFEGQRTGALGHAAAHSFYPTKNLGALGDAGAVTTDDERLARCVRALGNYGSLHRYRFDYQGMNSRLDEVQAAVLRVKLLHLDDDNVRRQALAQRYYRHLSQISHITLPSLPPSGQHVYHLFPILADRRDELKTHLEAHGIMTDIHYPIPPHRQKCYPEWSHLSLPVTEHIHCHELSLPLNPSLTEEQVDQIAETILSFKG